MFTFLTNNAEADKTAFGKGLPEDIERVKQISLDYLLQSTANRPLGGANDLKAETVFFDDLKMAHT